MIHVDNWMLSIKAFNRMLLIVPERWFISIMWVNLETTEVHIFQLGRLLREW